MIYTHLAGSLSLEVNRLLRLGGIALRLLGLLSATSPLTARGSRVCLRDEAGGALRGGGQCALVLPVLSAAEKNKIKYLV